MTTSDRPRVPSRRLRRAGPAALALVLAAALAACGGSDSGSDSDSDSGAAAPGTTAAQQEPATSSGSTDPCGFLTTAEVAAAGVPGTTPQPVETATGGLACNYVGDDPRKGVQVIVQPGGGQPYFDQSKDLLTAPEPVSGLGDEAVQDASTPEQTSVLVLEDDTVLTVGGSIPVGEARTLAEKALGRLGG